MKTKAKKLGGGSLGSFPLAFEILLNKAPIILKQKRLKYYNIQVAKLTIAKNLIFWMKLVKLTNKKFY